jgi:hypothetical protein
MNPNQSCVAIVELSLCGEIDMNVWWIVVVKIASDFVTVVSVMVESLLRWFLWWLRERKFVRAFLMMCHFWNGDSSVALMSWPLFIGQAWHSGPMSLWHLFWTLFNSNLDQFRLRGLFAISGKFGTNLQFLEKGLENEF